MNTQVSRDHHTVPKLYLQGFCVRRGLEKHKVMARHRDGTEQMMHINDASVRFDFYDLGTTQQPDDALENWFNTGVESPVGDIMGALRRGVLPTSTRDKETLARFVAAQMVRTVAFRDLMHDMDSHLWPLMFASMAVGKMIEDNSAIKDDPDYMQELHGYFAARARERPRTTSKESMLRTMIRRADQLLPVLLGMDWLLVESSTPMLLTGDTPAVTVSGTGEVTHGPLLQPELHEIHLPVTPQRLLIISPFTSLAPASTLTIGQAALVNEAIVRACATSVFRHPATPWPADLTLPSKPVPLHAPTVTVSPGTDEPRTRPEFPTITDQTLQEALALLGGDPDLDWP